MRVGKRELPGDYDEVHQSRREPDDHPGDRILDDGGDQGGRSDREAHRNQVEPAPEPNGPVFPRRKNLAGTSIGKCRGNAEADNRAREKRRASQADGMPRAWVVTAPEVQIVSV